MLCLSFVIIGDPLRKDFQIAFVIYNRDHQIICQIVLLLNFLLLLGSRSSTLPGVIVNPIIRPDH